ncbi:unnamed protein product [Prorocentrum cordatum]|uniref:Uncharacterized protein n=1 Tax=Prorocentrum cordatum TaxID=2364126 RepID=A0ABN9U0L5_9DINO|nr:unnamed protein product [Polarella glacialis]
MPRDEELAVCQGSKTSGGPRCEKNTTLDGREIADGLETCAIRLEIHYEQWRAAHVGRPLRAPPRSRAAWQSGEEPSGAARGWEIEEEREEEGEEEGYEDEPGDREQ